MRIWSNQLGLAAFISTAMFTLSAPVQATELAIIDKVIEGYGGKKFENMRSLTIHSDLRYGWIGQGHTPDLVELEPMKKIYNFDFKTARASEEAWGGRGAYSERVFVDDKGQTTINYIEGTYETDPEAGYYDHFGGEIRSSDTMIAYELVKQRETAVHKRDEFYRGELHHVLDFDMLGTTIDPTAWVNARTGHISIIKRDVPDYNVISYVFDDFRQTKGITYAEDFDLFIGNDLIEYTKSRSILPNRVKTSAFEIEREMRPMPEVWESTEISVDRVAPDLYHVGQGGSFSGFVDRGDHLVALGGYGGLKDRYEAYVEAHGEKPLRYVILTHHHSDHVAGAGDALELGAKLVMPESARRNVIEAASSDIAEDKIVILTEDKTTISDVDIYMMSTPHVQDYALIHVPSAKAIFQEDHYNSNFKSRPARVTQTALFLKQKIDDLELDVEHIVGSHARKVESWNTFALEAKTPLVGMCPTKRKICS